MCHFAISTKNRYLVLGQDQEIHMSGTNLKEHQQIQ